MKDCAFLDYFSGFMLDLSMRKWRLSWWVASGEAVSLRYGAFEEGMGAWMYFFVNVPVILGFLPVASGESLTTALVFMAATELVCLDAQVSCMATPIVL